MSFCYFCYQDCFQETTIYGLHLNCYQKSFHLVDMQSRFEDLYIHNPHVKKRLHKHNTSFFQGAFEKYSATLEKKDYIIKLAKEYPELPHIEFICNQIARALELIVPEHHLCEFSFNHPCFVTYNFMQDYLGCDLKHIYHFIPEGAEFSVETVLSAIEKQTGRLSEIHKFIQICIFDAFIGNHDRHGRNIAFIIRPESVILSPIYDNPSYFGIAPFLQAENNPRGRISTKCQADPLLSDYIQEFQRLGFEEYAMEFLKKISALHVAKYVDIPLLSQERKTAFLHYLTKKQSEAQNALQQ